VRYGGVLSVGLDTAKKKVFFLKKEAKTFIKWNLDT
jgi:hypothetical protein